MRKILITGLCFLCSCMGVKENELPYMDISIVRDVTDIHLLQPDPDAVLRMYNISEHKRFSAGFRYREITEMILAPVVSLRLPDASETSSKNKSNIPNFREQIILAFYDSIRKTLRPTEQQGNSSLRSHSQCYRIIAEELQRLAQSNSRSRVILIYSNLFENSELLSVYTEGKNKLMDMDAGDLRGRLEKTNLLTQNLLGIRVFFLYQPRTQEEDKQYYKIVGVYKRLLEERGAEVMVLANNP